MVKLFKWTVSCKSTFESHIIQSKQFQNLRLKYFTNTKKYALHYVACHHAHPLVNISSHSRLNRGTYNVTQSESSQVSNFVDIGLSNSKEYIFKMMDFTETFVAARQNRESFNIS